MTIIYHIILVLTILTVFCVACDAKQESAVESDSIIIESKDSLKQEAAKSEETKSETIKDSCEI